MLKNLFRKTKPVHKSADGPIQMMASIEELAQFNPNKLENVDNSENIEVENDDDMALTVAQFPENKEIVECFKYLNEDMNAPIVSKDFKYELNTIYYRNWQKHGYYGYKYGYQLIDQFLSNLSGKTSYRFFSGEGIETRSLNPFSATEFEYLKLKKEITQKELFYILKEDSSSLFYVNEYEDLVKSFKNGIFIKEILLKPQIEELINYGYSETFAAYFILNKCVQESSFNERFDKELFEKAVLLGKENISSDIRALILLT